MIDAVVGWTLPLATLAVLGGVSRLRLRMAGPVTAAGSHGTGDHGVGAGVHAAGAAPTGSVDAEDVTQRLAHHDGVRPTGVNVIKASCLAVRHELLPVAGGSPVPLPAGVSSLPIGRAPDSGLTLAAGGVSWRHARLRRSGQRGGEIAVLEDCQSTNGTTVNGERLVGAVALHNGDVVRFGGAAGVTFEYRRVAAWSALPAEVTA